MAAGPSFFLLDQKETKKSRTKEAADTLAITRPPFVQATVPMCIKLEILLILKT
jgi:hypothetical protein